MPIAIRTTEEAEELLMKSSTLIDATKALYEVHNSFGDGLQHAGSEKDMLLRCVADRSSLGSQRVCGVLGRESGQLHELVELMHLIGMPVVEIPGMDGGGVDGAKAQASLLPALDRHRSPLMWCDGSNGPLRYGVGLRQQVESFISRRTGGNLSLELREPMFCIAYGHGDEDAFVSFVDRGMVWLDFRDATIFCKSEKESYRLDSVLLRMTLNDNDKMTESVHQMACAPLGAGRTKVTLWVSPNGRFTSSERLV